MFPSCFPSLFSLSLHFLLLFLIHGECALPIPRSILIVSRRGVKKKKVKTLHFKENVYAKLVRRHGNEICQDRFSISALFSVSVNDNKQAGEIVKIDNTGPEREREWASGIYDKQLERGHPSPELRAYGTRKKKKKNRKGGGCFVSCNTDRIV